MPNVKTIVDGIPMEFEFHLVVRPGLTLDTATIFWIKEVEEILVKHFKEHLKEIQSYA